jgi:hypothetical protein
MSHERWLRQPGEPGGWFARYEIYRLLGPRRTIEKAYVVAREAEGLKGVRAASSWYENASKWRWRERAEAWDEAERQVFLQSELTRRTDARRRRLELIEAAQEQAYAALNVASLAELKATAPEDVAAAREMLATVRMLLFDALKAQRLEYGESTEIVSEGVAPYSADEMASAMAEVEAWRKRRMSAASG